MRVDGPPLVGLLAATFGVVTVALCVVAVLATPVALGAAVPFSVATALLWYHASGRFTERVRRSADGRRRDRRADSGGRRRRRRRRRRRTGSAGADRSDRRDRPDRSEALETLGLEAGASQQEVRQAYRTRVKEVHPDRGGDEQAFRRVTEAYERLSE